MIVILDANILLRLAEPQHRFHPEARDSTERLRRRGHELCIIPQGLYEFWVVATRPKSTNGLGMEMPEVAVEVNRLLAVLTLLADNSAVFTNWVHLVCTHNVKGKPAHDARIVAWPPCAFTPLPTCSRSTTPTSFAILASPSSRRPTCSPAPTPDPTSRTCRP